MATQPAPGIARSTVLLNRESIREAEDLESKEQTRGVEVEEGKANLFQMPILKASESGDSSSERKKDLESRK